MLGAHASRLPCGPGEALPLHTVQRTGLEHGHGKGTGGLLYAGTAGLAAVEGQLVGDARGPVAAIAARCRIGLVLYRLAAQGIVGHRHHDVTVAGAGPHLYRLQRPAQPVEVLDALVLLAERAGIVQVLGVHPRNPEGAGEHIVPAAAGRTQQWPAVVLDEYPQGAARRGMEAGQQRHAPAGAQLGLVVVDGIGLVLLGMGRCKDH